MSCSNGNYKSKKIVRKVLKNGYPVFCLIVNFRWNKDQRPFKGSPAFLKAFICPSDSGCLPIDRSFLFPILCLLRQRGTLPSIFAIVGSIRRESIRKRSAS